MRILYWQTSANKITLEQAVKECSDYLADAVALIYSPQKCYFVKVNSGNIEQPPLGEKVEINSVFEARIFNEEAELRWLNERNGEGRSVLISEQNFNLCWKEIEELKAIAIQNQQYILWGKAKMNSATTGWSQLVSNRIGSLYVPCDDIKNRVCLKTCEYLTEDDYGNVAVVEERLIKLEPIS
ncbi:MAG TPA: TIGR03984 family CRISPR-associated protein [Cyanobacteria bacterium UBA11162]|nr:TIGR03984 family CRISPR-associated protein [Cyanobacteria bacterium UBA11162]